MQSIVLATHGGVSADGAALAASLLAARLHVPLIPLVVCAPIHVVDYGLGASDAPSPEDIAAVEGAIAASVTDQLRRCGIRSLSPTVRTGIVPMEIAAAARALRAGLGGDRTRAAQYRGPGARWRDGPALRRTRPCRSWRCPHP